MLIIELLIPAVKDIDIDVNIHNTKVIYIKYKQIKLEDPGSCLKREIIFLEDENKLIIELPKK